MGREIIDLCNVHRIADFKMMVLFVVPWKNLSRPTITAWLRNSMAVQGRNPHIGIILAGEISGPCHSPPPRKNIHYRYPPIGAKLKITHGIDQRQTQYQYLAQAHPTLRSKGGNRRMQGMVLFPHHLDWWGPAHFRLLRMSVILETAQVFHRI